MVLDLSILVMTAARPRALLILTYCFAALSGNSSTFSRLRKGHLEDSSAAHNGEGLCVVGRYCDKSFEVAGHLDGLISRTKFRNHGRIRLGFLQAYQYHHNFGHDPNRKFDNPQD